MTENVVMENAATVSVDLTNLELLAAQQNDLLLHIYAALLFFIGVIGAGCVVFLLYKFLRKFY